MKDFDELLDGILRENSSTQPRAGLEARVIARVRADRRRPVWRLVTWGAVAAALPCVVALLVWPRNVPVPRIGESPAIAASAVPKNVSMDSIRTRSVSGVQAKAPVRQKGAMMGQAAEPLPKLDVFPSPAPEDMFPRPVKADEGERQLAGLRSKKVGEALVALHQEQNQSIQIVAIEITPIQMDGAAGRD